jgi:hypothetical protein
MGRQRWYQSKAYDLGLGQQGHLQPYPISGDYPFHEKTLKWILLILIVKKIVKKNDKIFTNGLLMYSWNLDLQPMV